MVSDPRQAVVTRAVDVGPADRAAGLDEAAFSDLYRRVARPLWGYLRRLTGDAALADDLLQEAFTRLLVQDAPPMGEAAQRAWLFRVASNLAVDAARRTKRERPADEAAPDAVAGPAPASDPILAREMGRTFSHLGTQERALLWLAYVEESSHREIAGALGVKESSIRVLLFRARKKLAGLWRLRREERG